MSVTKEDLVESFTSLETPVFKRKVYDSCILYTMEKYKILKNKFETDMFPSESYYSIEDRLSDFKPTPTSEHPKKKRSPVRRQTKQNITNVLHEGKNDNNCDKTDNKIVEEKGEKKKKKKKSYPITFNKNARTYIDFIVSRFLWEIFSIDAETEWPENKEAIENYALKHAPENFQECNITELVIHSIRIYQPSKYIPNSHGLDRELRNKFDEYLNNATASNFAATYITDFLKLLSVFFANKFWLDKTQTVNIKHFETILRYIELVIPIECKTVSSGLVTEMNQYDIIVNPNKSTTRKSPSDSVGIIKKVEKEPVTTKSKKEPVTTKSKKAPVSTKSKKAPVSAQSKKVPASSQSKKFKSVRGQYEGDSNEDEGDSDEEGVDEDNVEETDDYDMYENE